MRMMGERRRPRIPAGYWRVGHCGHLPMPPRRMMLQAVRKFIYVGVARDSQAVRPCPLDAFSGPVQVTAALPEGVQPFA